MKLNYDKLHEFLKVDDYGYYDSRSISLTELYDNPCELTIDDLIELLADIYAYTEEQSDHSETAVYDIKIKYSPKNYGEETYVLEMYWPSDFDTRH